MRVRGDQVPSASRGAPFENAWLALSEVPAGPLLDLMMRAAHEAIPVLNHDHGHGLVAQQCEELAASAALLAPKTLSSTVRASSSLSTLVSSAMRRARDRSI